MARFLLILCLASAALAQAPPPAAAGRDHDRDRVLKEIDDQAWRTILADVATVDKVTIPSMPPSREPNPTAQGAGNPLLIYVYVIIPKKLDRSRKNPWLVYTHGGVHANFSSRQANLIREMIEEGYPVISTDYRGSTGYGRSFYEAIDYGGRENDDVFAARNWAVETYPFLDPARCGILGWSHGGMITLMNIFSHPEAYKVAYAGVPVSDLVARMGYKSDSYRRLFSAPYHIGKSADQNVEEYVRRSPVSHAAKLATPLLIHTNTNDEDVNVLEVRRLIAALKAEGKVFEYKIYENAPGGHVFNRIDTKAARESRAEILRFLGRHLK